jgi:hypothetical protein
MWRGFIMASDPNQIGVHTPISNENVSNSPKKEKHSIALAPLRRLMKSEGVTLISNDALVFLDRSCGECRTTKTDSSFGYCGDC